MMHNSYSTETQVKVAVYAETASLELQGSRIRHFLGMTLIGIALWMNFA